MTFGSVLLDAAEGAILAHSVLLPDGRLSKGMRLGEAEITRLRAAGIGEVIAARLDREDVTEDEAAAAIAAAIPAGSMTVSRAATGRVNVHAAVNGLFVADRDAVDRLNRVDPSITLACLRDHVSVRAGEMVATIKIIPLALPQRLAETAAAILLEGQAFAVKPFLACSVTLVATLLPSLKPQVLDKTRHVLEGRLQRSDSRLTREIRVPHTVEAVAGAIRAAAVDSEMVVVFGASAVADSQDVIPAAIRAAGGQVRHIGMPVDPGNLLVIADLDATPVIGAPGCARSPKENGFDWVLDRILAGETPGTYDLTGMGVGGLLAEISARPQPRSILGDRPSSALVVPVIVLAAGWASRMGPAGAHKLLAELDGVPLVRHVVATALSAAAADVIVVTGHRREEIEAALHGFAVTTAHNPDFASGMASSLIAGLGATGDAADGVVVMLADMPAITPSDLGHLFDAFREHRGQAVVRAVSGGKRGNPVILPRAMFAALRTLEGDVGARHVIENGGLPVIDVEIGPAAHLDLDTPDAIIAAGGVLKG